MYMYIYIYIHTLMAECLGYHIMPYHHIIEKHVKPVVPDRIIIYDTIL